MSGASREGKMVLAACGRLLALYVGVGIVLRVLLALHPLTEAGSLTFWQWVGAFVLGAVNDAAVMTLMLLPLVVFWMSSGHWKLRRPQCFVGMALLVGLWTFVTFGWRQLRDFNGVLTDVLGYVVLFWLATFALRAFVPKIRVVWMRCWTAAIVFVYVFLIFFDCCGEWLFWNEFGVRYNFIAVDYLVYTGEVVGNILQSYSIGWLMAAVVAAAVATEWVLMGSTVKASAEFHAPGWRWRVFAVSVVAAVCATAVLPLTEKAQHSRNAWYNELQAAGPYSFVQAFLSNRLDYRDFYATMPDAEADARLQELLRATTDSTAVVKRPHIVLITMESMSADYMRRFGNEEGLTPVLDSLWSHSLSFDRMFAAGNRTVRGLEALVMSRPPTPGESIIKRPGALPELPSIVPALAGDGYRCLFYYGGDSYFDNMEAFFEHLGYEIRDRKTMSADEITCQTVWGVCDGDVYRRLITELDSADATGQPVFAHVLTTSNHRPYIYPDGTVAIPPSQKSRKGAVMYSDYALGRFLAEARSHSWSDNTVFVIVADHCASSAGSTELPLANYHIPALIHAPGLVGDSIVSRTASQIDLMPTLFSLLGRPAPAGLYGCDVLSQDYRERAFVATYQDLGYYAADTLTVLSPGDRCRQFVVTPTADNPFAMREVDADRSSQAFADAVTYYQTASESLY